MGPYKITMRLDFFVVTEQRLEVALSLLHSHSLLSSVSFLFFSFSFFFRLSRRIRASATVLTDRRSYNKLRNNNFISSNKTPLVPSAPCFFLPPLPPLLYHLIGPLLSPLFPPSLDFPSSRSFSILFVLNISPRI